MDTGNPKPIAEAKPAEPQQQTQPSSMPDPNLGEAELAGRRLAAASAVSELDNVFSADWSTQSTLVIKLDHAPSSPETSDEQQSEDPLKMFSAQVCQILLRSEELRYTRLQYEIMHPTNEAEKRVRWQQCR